MPGSPWKGRNLWGKISRLIAWVFYFLTLSAKDHRWVLRNQYKTYQPELSVPRLHQKIMRSTIFVFVRNAAGFFLLAWGAARAMELPVDGLSIFSAALLMALVTIFIAASK